VVAALPHDTHPMAVLLTGLAALSGAHPEQNPALAGEGVYKSRAVQDKQIARLVGKVRGRGGGSGRGRGRRRGGFRQQQQQQRGLRRGAASKATAAAPSRSLAHPQPPIPASNPPNRQISTLAALAYHKSTGRRATQPNQRLGFAENFLFMLDANGVPNYRCARRAAAGQQRSLGRGLESPLCF
jgi:citrate synthase